MHIHFENKIKKEYNKDKFYISTNHVLMLVNLRPYPVQILSKSECLLFINRVTLYLNIFCSILILGIQSELFIEVF